MAVVITKLGLSVKVEENVACLDVSVDLPLEMEVLKTLQSIEQYHPYLLLLQL